MAKIVKSRNTSYKPTPIRPADYTRYDEWRQSDPDTIYWASEVVKNDTTKNADMQYWLNQRLDLDIIKIFNLYTIQYGNWVKMPTRVNFLVVLYSSLNDLKRIMKLKNAIDIGKGVLALDWGGAGKRGANGYYRSGQYFINLRRFSRPDKLLNKMAELGINPAPYIDKYFDKENIANRGQILIPNKKGWAWLMGSSGFGSFAHEYWHFMDNFVYDPNGKGVFTGFCSGSAVLPYKVTENGKQKIFNPENLPVADVADYFKFNESGVRGHILEARKIVIDLILGFYYVKKGKDYVPSAKCKALFKYCTDFGAQPSYWCSTIELSARIFEIWVTIQKRKMNIEETFLVGELKKYGIQQKVLDGKDVSISDSKAIYVDTRAFTPSLINKVFKFITIFEKTKQ